MNILGLISQLIGIKTLRLTQGIEEVLILQIWEWSVIFPNYGVASLVSPKDGLSM